MNVSEILNPVQLNIWWLSNVRCILQNFAAKQKNKGPLHDYSLHLKDIK